MKNNELEQYILAWRSVHDIKLSEKNQTTQVRRLVSYRFFKVSIIAVYKYIVFDHREHNFKRAGLKLETSNLSYKPIYCLSHWNKHLMLP